MSPRENQEADDASSSSGRTAGPSEGGNEEEVRGPFIVRHATSAAALMFSSAVDDGGIEGQGDGDERILGGGLRPGPAPQPPRDSGCDAFETEAEKLDRIFACLSGMKDAFDSAGAGVDVQELGSSRAGAGSARQRGIEGAPCGSLGISISILLGLFALVSPLSLLGSGAADSVGFCDAESMLSEVRVLREENGKMRSDIGRMRFALLREASPSARRTARESRQASGSMEDKLNGVLANLTDLKFLTVNATSTVSFLSGRALNPVLSTGWNHQDSAPLSEMARKVEQILSEVNALRSGAFLISHGPEVTKDIRAIANSATAIPDIAALAVEQMKCEASKGNIQHDTAGTSAANNAMHFKEKVNDATSFSPVSACATKINNAVAFIQDNAFEAFTLAYRLLEIGALSEWTPEPPTLQSWLGWVIELTLSDFLTVMALLSICCHSLFIMRRPETDRDENKSRGAGTSSVTAVTSTVNGAKRRTQASESGLVCRKDYVKDFHGNGSDEGSSVLNDSFLDHDVQEIETKLPALSLNSSAKANSPASANTKCPTPLFPPSTTRTTKKSISWQLTSSFINESKHTKVPVRCNKKSDKDVGGPITGTMDCKSGDDHGIIPKRQVAQQLSFLKKCRGSASGLGNLGNTCFMNCTLQCLAHTELFREYFIHGDYVRDLNRGSPPGTGGEIATEFARLLRQMWGSECSANDNSQRNGGTNDRSYNSGGHSTLSSAVVYPRNLKSILDQRAEQFKGSGQHDAQEFTSFLLDALHEDTNRIAEKPQLEMPEQKEDEPDDEAAKKAWSLRLRSENSRILDIFLGQIRSRIQCPREDCGRVSTTFDPFMFLSVPIPEVMDRTVVVTYVPLNPYQRMKKLRVTLNKASLIATLQRKVVDILNGNSLEGKDEGEQGIGDRALADKAPGILAEDICLADVWNHKVCSFYAPDDEVDKIQGNCTHGFTYAFHLQGVLSIHEELEQKEAKRSKHRDGVVVHVVHKQQSQPSTIARAPSTFSRSSVGIDQSFGVPLTLRVSPCLTVHGLRKLLARRLARVIRAEEVGDMCHGHSSPSPTRILNQVEPWGGDEEKRVSSYGEDDNDEDGATNIANDKEGNNVAEAHESEPHGLEVIRQIPMTYERKSVTSYNKSHQSYQKLGSLLKGNESISGPRVSLSFASPSDEGEGNFVADLVGPHGTVMLHWPLSLAKRLDEDEWGHVEDMHALDAGEEDKNLRKWQEKQVDLLGCISNYCQMEQLRQSELWYCSCCKENVGAWKQCRLYRAPPVLMIHLKRFRYSATTHRRDKIDSFVDFPLTGLDLSHEVMHWEEGQEPVYDCYAISNHYGGLGGGHYTASALNDDGVWCHFDDSHVKVGISERELKSAAAYLLFYKRRGVKADALLTKSMGKEDETVVDSEAKEPGASSEDTVAQFMSLTGSANTDQAKFYLEMGGRDLQTAVGLYIEHSAGEGGRGSEGPGRIGWKRALPI